MCIGGIRWRRLALLSASEIRITGSGSRPWGRPVDAPSFSTASMKGWEHEPGDFTAVIGAGELLEDVQSRLAAHDQMLAVDPSPGGTVGGLVATADSGPLRHRYGAVRDLVIGVQMALADGTLARGGGRVIKNVAGYDLPKLAAGSFGTLGVITEVAVRCHPRPSAWATAVVPCPDADFLQRRAIELARRPLEAEALDLRWDGSAGSLLVRFAGPASRERAAEIGGEVIEEDESVWAEQRSRQRGDFVVRVHALPTEIASVLRLGFPAVGRAGVGTIWLRSDDPAPVMAAIATVTGAVVLDAPASARSGDPFGLAGRPELALMRAVKDRFDPHNRCNPGLLF